MKGLIVVLVLTLFCSGCAPTLIGGAFYKSAKTKESRQNFMSNLQDTNLQREKAGLKPLDFCTEAFRFDPHWTRKQLAECQGKFDEPEGSHVSNRGYKHDKDDVQNKD